MLLLGTMWWFIWGLLLMGIMPGGPLRRMLPPPPPTMSGFSELILEWKLDGFWVITWLGADTGQNEGGLLLLEMIVFTGWEGAGAEVGGWWWC